MKNITTFDMIIRVEKCPGLSKDELTRSKEWAILWPIVMLKHTNYVECSQKPA